MKKFELLIMILLLFFVGCATNAPSFDREGVLYIPSENDGVHTIMRDGIVHALYDDITIIIEVRNLVIKDNTIDFILSVMNKSNNFQYFETRLSDFKLEYSDESGNLQVLNCLSAIEYNKKTLGWDYDSSWTNYIKKQNISAYYKDNDIMLGDVKSGKICFDYVDAENINLIININNNKYIFEFSLVRVDS
jgi:hypothetical protein